MKRRFGKKKSSQNLDVSLNITPMADIFTILLVFLIKTYTSSSIILNPSQGVKLPIAEAAESTEEALKIEITPEAILIENNVIVSQIDTTKEDLNPLSKENIQLINEALSNEKKKQIRISQANSDIKEESKIIILSHESVPYSLVKKILTSAALNGYSDFKLAVVRRGQ